MTGVFFSVTIQVPNLGRGNLWQGGGHMFCGMRRGSRGAGHMDDEFFQ